MATADMIEMLHGRPANHLDFAADSTIEDKLYAFDLMEYDPRVKVIFVNIFGGAFDMIRTVEAIIKLHNSEVITKPMVLRLRGVHEDEAVKMMKEYLDSNEDARNSIHMIRDME